MKSFYSGTNNLKEFFLPKINSTQINKFFNKLQKTHHASDVALYSSGRVALFSCLKSMGISEGDEVIVSSFTCIVVINSIIYAGGTPVYTDIDLSNFNQNEDEIISKINKNTKFIILQHTFGIKSDFTKVRNFIKEHEIKIIEDWAHFYEDGPLQSDAIFISSDHSKVVNTVSGGILITKDHIIKDDYKLQLSSNFILEIKTKVTFLLDLMRTSPKNSMNIFNFIYKVFNKLNLTSFSKNESLLRKPNNYETGMTKFSAKILINQFKNINKNLNHRVDIASILNSHISWYKPENISLKKNTWLRYSFLVRNRKEFCRLHKIDERELWFTYPLQGMSYDPKIINYDVSLYPNALFASEHIINLPTHLKMSKQDFTKVIESVTNKNIINFIEQK
jgi:dTDP-4-amino-4,6-dideoxygalactose transaminase